MCCLFCTGFHILLTVYGKAISECHSQAYSKMQALLTVIHSFLYSSSTRSQLEVEDTLVTMLFIKPEIICRSGA